MKKKTIAFVIGSLYSGGAERVVSTLANKLTIKYNVVIIQLVHSEPFYKLNDDIKVVACNQKSEKSKNLWQAIGNNIRIIRRIVKFVKQEQISLLIGFITNVNILSIIASKISGISCIISERNNPKIENAPKKKWAGLTTILYNKAKILVVQTKEIKVFFDKKMDSKKVVILPNPLSEDLKIDFNIKKENIILNVGRLTYQKGQDLLIKAFSNINPENWKLVLVGVGNEKSNYIKLIDELEMNDKIFLVGQKKDISKSYNNAKIFCFPSRFEGFPNALIEAMHMGLACVSADCPTGPSELIDDGENGFLINMDSVEELQEKLQLLINDEQLIQKFSKNGKKIVQNFEVETVAKEWDDYIQLALKS